MTLQTISSISLHLSYYETFHNFVSLKHTIYFAGCNSQYINTASFCRLVPDALQTFSASPTIRTTQIYAKVTNLKLDDEIERAFE